MKCTNLFVFYMPYITVLGQKTERASSDLWETGQLTDEIPTKANTQVLNQMANAENSAFAGENITATKQGHTRKREREREQTHKCKAMKQPHPMTQTQNTLFTHWDITRQIEALTAITAGQKGNLFWKRHVTRWTRRKLPVHTRTTTEPETDRYVLLYYGSTAPA